MKLCLLLLVATLAALLSTGSAENSYAVYIPVHVRTGQPINFVCSIFNMNNSVGVVSYLYLDGSDDAFETEMRTINPGESAMISTVRIPKDEYTRMTLKVMGIDLVTDEEVFFNETSNFEFSNKVQSMFLQTDKAIYQPGQTVKFRGVNLDYDMRPCNTTMSFVIRDPSDNVIMLKEHLTPTMGVVSDELEIHADSPTGMWQLTIKDDSTRYLEQMEFEVKRYKLPKFEVEVDAPSFAHESQDGITIKLRAKYTYGKPVQGEGFLIVTLMDSWMYHVIHSRYTSDMLSPDMHQVRFKNFNGEAEVFLSKEKLVSMGWKGNYYRKKLEIEGHVTERHTDITFTDKKSIMLKEKSYKIEKMYAPKSAKPGLKYTAYLKVTQHDGTPVQDSFRENNLVNVHITSWKQMPWLPYYPVRQPIDYVLTDISGDGDIPTTTTPEPTTTTEPPTTTTAPDMDIYKSFRIAPTGEVLVEFEVPEQDFSEMSFSVSVNSTTYRELFFEANRAFSPSESYLQIETADTTFEPGSTANFTIRSNKRLNQISYMVKARGNIVEQVQENFPERSRNFAFELEITRDMMPSATLLVSYIAEDGEVVADFIKFNVATSLENQVSMESSSSSVDAGDDVTITVRTSEPGSYVGLKAVDKSVLLLKSGNDITYEKADENMQTYAAEQNRDDRRWWWWPVVNDGVDAHEIFKDAYINLLTDAYVHQEPERRYPVAFEMGVGFLAVASTRVPGDPMMKSSKAPRTYFPETWLWTDAITGEDGRADFTTNAPDTITSWVLNAFSISESTGLGIADETQIKVFRNFFVNLNLPLKVTRGEIIVVQALVFNYFNMDVEVTLTLHENSAGFELIMPVDDANVAGFVRRFTVPAQASYSVSYPIRMVSIGDVDMQVSASSPFAADSLIRQITVKPEGIQQCFSQSTLINRDGNDKNPTLAQLEVRIPDNVVEGSENVKLYVYGDIMGSTMRNLGQLLREPTGCGEQNMQSFAPDVFVTLYLQKAGRLDPETKEKAYKHFVQGYQNQLNYRHSDGSYSAFGKSDKSGSLWLTAFVTKCFIYAGKVRPEMQMQLQDSIDRAVDFLGKQIKVDGSFNEPGRVSAKYMQGGVDSSITMAAYVLITLTEAYVDRNFEEKTLRTRRYLESNLNSITSNPYALSIVTYALHTSGSHRAQEALDALEALSTTIDGQKYWHEEDEFSSTYDGRFAPCFYKPPSNDIEMTAYALLTYVRRGDLDSAVPVLKWLASKRNDLGGYSSTQNTVIAIQALSAVAAMFENQDQNVVVNVEMHDVIESVNIQDNNAMVFNRFDLPASNGNVKISADGSGVAIAQLSVCYNVMETPFQDSPFDCKLDISNGSLDSATLTFCCSLKKTADNSTGMLLYEINLPNGFTVDIKDELSNNKQAKLVEMKKGSANYYYDELLKDEEICSTTHLQRQEQVGANKPSTIIVQDYYQPERRFVASYSVGDLEDAEACNICGSDCAGCPGWYNKDRENQNKGKPLAICRAP